MACDTFIKIAQKCKKHFVLQQQNEVMPYIEEILAMINQITSDLSFHQVHTFYEAVGFMISAQPNKTIQDRLIAKLMEMPNTAVKITLLVLSITDAKTLILFSVM